MTADSRHNSPSSPPPPPEYSPPPGFAPNGSPSPTDDSQGERPVLWRSLVRLAVPSIIENMLQSAVYLVDALMLARVGELELAAVSLTGIFLWRLTEIVACFQKGTAAFVARRWGEGRHDRASRAATHGVTLAAVLGVVAVSAVFPFLGWVYRMLGGEERLIRVAVSYSAMVLLAFPFTQMFINLSASVRAAGDTRTPAFATILINSCNVVLNYLLIFGKFGFPRLGMQGAGIATGLSLFVGWAFLMTMTWRGLRPRSLFHTRVLAEADDSEKAIEAGGVPALGYLPLADSSFSPRALPAPRGVFRFTREGVRLWIHEVTPTIIRVTRPTVVEEIFVSIGFLAFYRMIAASGTTAMAADSAVVRIESLSFMLGMGFTVSASTLVGQALGRGDVAMARRVFWLCALFAMSLMGTLGICFVLGSRWFLLPFDTGGGFLGIATPLLIIAAMEQPMLGAAATLSGGLRGAGDTLSPTISQFFGTLVVRVGLGYYLAFKMGLGIQGVYWGTVIDWTVRTIILTALLFRGRWKTIRV